MEFRFDSTGIYESVESNKPDESNRPDESNESSERVMDFYVPRSRTPPNKKWQMSHLTSPMFKKNKTKKPGKWGK